MLTLDLNFHVLLIKETKRAAMPKETIDRDSTWPSPLQAGAYKSSLFHSFAQNRSS